MTPHLGEGSSNTSLRSAAIAKGQIADILYRRGELDEALRLQTERLETNRRLQDADGIAASLWDIAQVELQQGKIQEAAPRIAEAYALVEQTGRTDGIAAIGALFGQLLVMADEREEGLAVLRDSAAAFRKLGHEDQAEQIEGLIRQTEGQDSTSI